MEPMNASVPVEPAENDHLSKEEPVSSPSFKEFLFRYVPALDALRHYSTTSLRKDMIAGLTVAAVAIPQAMAYATIAGLPPQLGLYTAIVMTAAGALLDPTGKLINGPTNAISIALFSALAPIDAGLKIPVAVFLALLVGLIQTGITLLRLGDLTRYVSQAVLVGFTVGAAVLLILSQLQNLLGLPGQEAGDHSQLRYWLYWLHLDQLNGWTAAIGLGTIAWVLAIGWVNRRFHLFLPEMLLAVIVMAVVVWVGNLNAPERGVEVIKTIPRGLPAFDVPSLAAAGERGPNLRDLASSSLAIALLGLLEAITMAKLIAARSGKKLDINQQCLSEGVANLTGSFFSCFPGSGSLTRSAINQQAGAVSQWAGIIAAGVVALTVVFLADLAHFIPQAALAGILMVTAFRFVDWRQLLYYLRATRFDLGIVAATALAAVFVSVEFCILIGVFLSFILYVPRAANVHLTEFTLTPERVLRERMPSDPPCGRILIYSLEGELFFGSGPDVEDALATIADRAKDGIRIMVLRLKRVRNADAVCLALLDQFLRDMEQKNIRVFLCGVRADLARVLQSSGLETRLGKERIYREQVGSSSTLDAVRQAYEFLGDDLCSTCPRRGDAGGKEVLYYMI
jgi:SulP family sulfate permease